MDGLCPGEFAMRIGMVTQWYEPEPGAAAHPTAIARALASRGHDVRVLTGFPSYPNGRVYPGYRMTWRQREARDGLQLMRVPDVPSHDDSAWRRAASLTSFALSATAHVRWLRDADVCLTYLTPATVGLASLRLHRAAGVPFVLYVQDLWPESVTASGFIGDPRVAHAAERVIARGLAALYRRAHGVAAISPSMAATLQARGAPRVRCVPNWIDEHIFAPALPPSRPELDPARTWMMYAGGIGDVQGLDTVIRAVARAAVSRPTVALALVGDGVAVPRLRALAASLGVEDRVVFMGPRPMSQMPTLMAQAASQVVSLKNLPLFSGTIPSKVQASFACERLVVCAVAGDAATVVRDAGGLTVPPEDVSSLAQAFVEVASMSAARRDELGRQARRYYLEHLGAGSGAAALEGMLEDAVNGRGEGGRRG
ncbi:glycosyltransferase involved in cell wall biosynthesis [Nocardioides aurantiacus]|uniref:Glycosyltransferase involved in cell wall biosynthesis n=2 Tax=Nocardioides aurantiacus TaxID=86796 RepID=A0A3N2CYB7_9ACTN|nr:glycosyltransferase involved in cell wall biosynthesis [Nocardioides aurantiacus]